MSTAQIVWYEDAARFRERARLLERAREHLECGFVADAVRDLSKVIGLLGDSEMRVMQLHAECVSMLELARKILALDAVRRPIMVHIDAPPTGSEDK